MHATANWDCDANGECSGSQLENRCPPGCPPKVCLVRKGSPERDGSRAPKQSPSSPPHAQIATQRLIPVVLHLIACMLSHAKCPPCSLALRCRDDLNSECRSGQRDW